MNSDVEQIKPYHDGTAGKAEQVERMFDNIAPAYDFMNRAMTLGIDRWWRRRAVSLVGRHVERVAAPRMLDIATGTGDFAIALHKRCPEAMIHGIDLSEGMLNVGRKKVEQRHLSQAITFTRADALDLPFENDTFEAVTVAFGVRNFEHLDRGYAEMCRVLRSGGMVCVVELSTPTNRIIRWAYDLYTLHVIPFIGGLRSGDREAYRYLPRSIAAVPQAERMLELMSKAGFVDTHCHKLTFGTCSIYTAIKP